MRSCDFKHIQEKKMLEEKKVVKSFKVSRDFRFISSAAYTDNKIGE